MSRSTRFSLGVEFYDLHANKMDFTTPLCTSRSNGRDANDSQYGTFSSRRWLHGSGIHTESFQGKDTTATKFHSPDGKVWRGTTRTNPWSWGIPFRSLRSVVFRLGVGHFNIIPSDEDDVGAANNNNNNRWGEMRKHRKGNDQITEPKQPVDYNLILCVRRVRVGRGLRKGLSIIESNNKSSNHRLRDIQAHKHNWGRVLLCWGWNCHQHNRAGGEGVL